MAQKVLIVDDVREIVQGLAGYFRQAGFETLTACNGRQALDLAHREQPDLIILDIMMPDIDGLEVCRQIRRASDVPIIMLTARIEETDKLIGLELGADDYIVKPFSPREVVARARAILRRASGALVTSPVLHHGPITLDLTRRTVRAHDQQVELTRIEFDLLATLMRNAGRPLSRMQLLDAVQGDAYEGYERTKNLRRKIEGDPAHPRCILTVFGIGYKFNDELA